jgi:chromate transport protein ChrA
MTNLLSSIAKVNITESILIVILGLFFVAGYDLPESVSNVVDSVPLQISMFFVVTYLFIYKSPVLAVLFLIVVLDLMVKSSNSHSSYLKTNEKYKQTILSNLNEIPYTLEQDMVKKMAPLVNAGSSVTKSSFSPLIENSHDAISI